MRLVIGYCHYIIRVKRNLSCIFHTVWRTVRRVSCTCIFDGFKGRHFDVTCGMSESIHAAWFWNLNWPLPHLFTEGLGLLVNLNVVG